MRILKRQLRKGKESVCVRGRERKRQQCKPYLGLSVAVCCPGGKLICSTDKQTAKCTIVKLLLSYHNENNYCFDFLITNQDHPAPVL